MAGLADDWKQNRQTCVDVLCAYLRLPYDPDPGQTAPQPTERLIRRIGKCVTLLSVSFVTTCGYGRRSPGKVSTLISLV